MTSHFLSLVSTPSVKTAQQQNGSRSAYARHDGAVEPDRLTITESSFIAARDSFYMASVGETGWPYIQHRGGPVGFARVLGDHSIGLADFRGNRQYVSIGNIAQNDRVSLFFMDYVNRRRLKVLGRMRVVDMAEEPDLADALVDPSYHARVERALVVKVEAFDWNCPQHITPRYTLEEIRPIISALQAEIAALKANAATSETERAPRL